MDENLPDSQETVVDDARTEDVALPDAETLTETSPSAETLQEIAVATAEINQKLDTVTNCLIVAMVGIALVVGVVASTILSRFFHA